MSETIVPMNDQHCWTSQQWHRASMQLTFVEMEDPNEAPPRVNRFRFSLRTLFVAALIVSLAVSHVGTSWQLRNASQSNAKLMAQNSALRRELGYFDVEDPSKVYVLNLPTLEAYTWRWRMYVPKGHGLTIHKAFSDIPEAGLAHATGSSSFPAEGEFVLTAMIRRDHENRWSISLGTEQSSTRTSIDDKHSKWITDSGGVSSSTAGGGKGPEVVAPGQDLVLVRLRAHEKRPDGGSRSAKGPADGIMLWLNGTPQSSQTGTVSSQ